MDDLDHSIHMSENDWSVFCEESEECVLLQASLACSDDSSLSDLEDSGNSGLVSSAGHRDARQSPDVNGHGDDGNHSQKQDKHSGVVPQDHVTRAELCLQAVHVVTGGDNTEERRADAVNTLKSVDSQSAGEPRGGNKNRNVQTESDLERSTEPDPLYRCQTRLGVNEPLAAERAASGASPQSVEKERWFVTVNENPARARRRASVKKRQRQKSPCDGSRTRRPELKGHFDNDVKVEEESDGEKKAQLIQNFAKMSQVHPCCEMNAGNDQVHEHVSEKMLIIQTPKDQMLAAKTDNHETGSSIDTLQDVFTSSQSERADLDEFDDNADFLSSHSYDSESYLSAAESMDELHALFEKSLLQGLGPLGVSNSSDTPDPQMYCHDSVDHSDAAAASCGGCESGSVELNLTFPSAGERASEMSADNATCESNIHGETTCTTPNASAAQSHQKALSVADLFHGDERGSSTVPSVTITTCSPADCPETFARAAGHVQPVYAISAFWDEMEKLTINDILHLKMGRSTPPGENQENPIHSADTSRSPLCECSLSDSGLMDASDTADSDYFTQPDESKPDCSSCAFSTSDFEEEYWQFLSRNPSPDPDSETPDVDAWSFPHEERGSSEGIRTPVPSEDSAGRTCGDEESRAPEPTEPRRMMKSKSMHNVLALKTDSLSSPSFGSHEERALFPNGCQPWKENVFLKVNDSLQTLNSMLYFDNADLLDICQQISFPEVFDDCLKDDKANTTSQPGKVYDPKEISVALFYDLPLSALNDEMSSSSLGCNTERPIPIFSYSHPTVRDLTFPKLHYAFLGSRSRGAEDISPMRFMCHPYLQDDRHGSCDWRNFLAIRKIHFHDKGSIRCGRPGVGMFPDEEGMLMGEEAVLSEGAASREFNEQRRVLETVQTKQVGKFSTLRQSDMCLVCIAVASWVLRSSDPDAADAWKAALLANVSALSAIRYLRM